MNRLRGNIAAVVSEGTLSLIDIAIDDFRLTAIMIGTPGNAPYLRVGHPVTALFKEMEVSIAKGLSGGLSLRNRLAATVTSIKRGVLLSEVTMDWNGGPLTSVITTRAVDRLALAAGDAVEALIKANEVMIEEDDGL
jgi:molybdate transport system regulatory protein